jgi:hypothetical protein
MKNLPFILLTLTALSSWQCTEKKPAFQPPIPAVDVPYATYEFVAEEGALINYPSGTRIIVPPDALTDEDGNSVKGKVTLKYRELHGAMDAFAAGISLGYDSAGTNYQFQTAGMMDISAYQGDQVLAIASGKEIDVNFASHQVGDDYNFYEWDEKAGRWIFKSGARPAKPNQAKKRLKDSLESVRAVNPKDLMLLHFGEALDVYFNYQYTKVNDKNLQTNFRRLLDTYGISVYENLNINTPVKLGKKSYYPAYTLVWQKLEDVQPPQWLNMPSESSRNDSDTYEYFHITSAADMQKDGSYKLSLQRSKTKQVRQSVTEYDTTWQVHSRTKQRRIGKITSRTVQRWKTVYENKVVNKFSFRARPYMRISEFLRRKPDNLSKEYEQLVQTINEQSRKIDEVAEVFRPISIGKFGLFNFDRIMKLPGAVAIMADFRLQQEQPEKIYYINVEQSTVVELTRDKWKDIYIAPGQTTHIFAVMPNYSIAYFPVEDWRKLDWYSLLQTKNYTFRLKKSDNPITTREQLKKVLQM